MTPTRLLIAVLVLAGVAVGGLTALDAADARRPEPQVAAPAAPVRTGSVALLAAWDERRSAAWAAGDPAALGRLYTPGSAAGRADVDMLGRWAERGLRVTGLRMQVLAVDVRSAGPTRQVLDVTDRLAGGVAIGAGRREPLPADAWSTRRVVLARAAGEWRVASVRTVRPPAPR